MQVTEIEIYDEVLNSWFHYIVWTTLLKCLTVTSNWCKVLANTSIYYQRKNFEGVLYVAKHAQSTDSENTTKDFWTIYANLQQKWTN